MTVKLTDFIEEFRLEGLYDPDRRASSAKVPLISYPCMVEAWDWADGDFFLLLKAGYQCGMSVNRSAFSKDYRTIKAELEAAVVKGVNKSFIRSLRRNSFTPEGMRKYTLTTPIVDKLLDVVDKTESSVIDIRVPKETGSKPTAVKPDLFSEPAPEPVKEIDSGLNQENVEDFGFEPEPEVVKPKTKPKHEKVIFLNSVPSKKDTNVFVMMDGYIAGGKLDFQYDGSGGNRRALVVNWVDRDTAHNSKVLGSSLNLKSSDTIFYKYDNALRYLNCTLLDVGMQSVAFLEKALKNITDKASFNDLLEKVKDLNA